MIVRLESSASSVMNMAQRTDDRGCRLPASGFSTPLTSHRWSGGRWIWLV